MRTLASAILCIVMLSGCDLKPSTPATSANSQKQAKKWEREEFKKLVIGKTKDEVIKAVGSPKRSSEDSSGLRFVYEDVTVDPVSGKPDSLVVVFFDSDGKVRSVSF